MSEKANLQNPQFVPFTVREIKPQGWLRRQLRIQADGLCGNLDKIWNEIYESRWAGGGRDGWEILPYWLDGFIPLGWLLDDEELKARGKKYIDCIIAGQKADGWLCPCEDKDRARYDIWAFFLVCKVLTVYADCSGDPRIETVLSKALHSIAAHLGGTLFDWGAARWFECLIPVFWLYERTGEPWLLDLAHRLEVLGINYEKLFLHYADQEPQRRWTFITHVVNIAMALKSGALTSRFRGGDPNVFARMALDKLFTWHGTAAGHFTGDECVAGTSPVQGTELCGVVEAMYSYETLISVGGAAEWADHLEDLAFNALPAAISPDMKTHQYDQMVNQVQCSVLPKDHVVFMTNGADAHVFGWGPKSGCCTPNFSQGWPKFALSAFMKAPDGIVSVLPVPSELNCTINGTGVRITAESEYPFRDSLRYTIETEAPVHFSFYVRIPGRAKSALVDTAAAAPGSFFKIEREWKGKSEIEAAFGFECELEKRPQGMYCLRRGPFVFSVAPRERWEKEEYVRNGIELKYPYCEYKVFPESPWNYAFTGDSMEAVFSPVGDIPFSPEYPPVRVRTKMAPIKWDMENGVCEIHPSPKATGAAVEIELVPYGCTTLRVTEIPMAE